MKKLFATLIAVSMCFTLAACGPDSAKVEHAQDLYAGLTERLNNDVKPLVDELSADGLIGQDIIDSYNNMADEINKLGEQDTSAMSDEELDMLIDDMDEMLDIISEMTDNLLLIHYAS